MVRPGTAPTGVRTGHTRSSPPGWVRCRQGPPGRRQRESGTQGARWPSRGRARAPVRRRTPAVTSASAVGGDGVGARFTVHRGGYVTGVRFYKGSGTPAPTWVACGRRQGALLAATTFTGESASGGSRRLLLARCGGGGDRRTRSATHAPNGRYAVTTGFFSSSSCQRIPLTATRGVYRYGGGGVFPTSTHTPAELLGGRHCSQDAAGADTSRRRSCRGADGRGDRGAGGLAGLGHVRRGDRARLLGLGGPAGRFGRRRGDGVERGDPDVDVHPSPALATSTPYTVTISGVADAAGQHRWTGGPGRSPRRRPPSR